MDRRSFLREHGRAVRLRLQRFARESSTYYDPTLLGYCARAAAQLYARVRAHDLDAELRFVKDVRDWRHSVHVFVRADRNWLVDVTATQFNVKRADGEKLDIEYRAIEIVPWSRDKGDTCWAGSIKVEPDWLMDYTTEWGHRKQVTRVDFTYAGDDWSRT